MRKMDNRADPVGTLNFVQFLIDVTTHKNVTGEQRLVDPDDAAPGRPFDAQAGMKHLQLEIFAQIRRGDMLMLRLRPGTVPGQRLDLNCRV